MRRRIGKDKHCCPRTGKVRYRDEKSARLVVKRASKFEGRKKPVRCYGPCEFCAGWHLTSQELR